MKKFLGLRNKNLHNKILTAQGFLIALAAGVILINVFELSQDLVKTTAKRQTSLFRFSGLKFMGLGQILRHATYVGYYTDRDLLKDTDAAAEFAQAQYILAPIILEANNTTHTFTLFDCTKEEIAFKKIKEIGVTPMKRNKFGIILAIAKEKE